MLPVSDVRVLDLFQLTCVHIIFSSVWVAGWPPFGKYIHVLLTRLTMYSHCFFYYNLVISRFGFEGWILGSGCFNSWSLHTFYFL